MIRSRTGYRFPIASVRVSLLLAGALLVGQGAWIHLKAALGQWLVARAWSEQLASGGHPAPWPWADTWPVARLSVEKQGLSQFVLANASGRNMAWGPTHVAPSALPGLPGHSVISGHRDTHFSFLQEVDPGDILSVENADGVVHYEVVLTEIMDVRSEQLSLDPDGQWLTLVTCYPFDAVTAGGPLRYAVHARRLGAVNMRVADLESASSAMLGERRALR
jgi:sortase A